jgi:TRAP-type C4-dicarboxylate transport system permease small subunit
LPRVGALERVRSNPKLAVAIAGGIVLLLTWIGWAIHVAGDNGGRAALGVLIAWPALLVAVALVSLALIGGYRLVSRLSADQGGATATADEETPADETEDEPEEPESSEDDEEEEAESDSEPEASAKS